MKYRQLTATGDSTFGSGFTVFLVNTPETVGQAILTRLELMTNEWFLDNTEGTPYQSQILGTGTASTRDRAVQNRVLGTPGAQNIETYQSQVGPTPRQFVVQMTVNTIYGPVDVEATLPPTPPTGQAGQLDFVEPDNSGFIATI